MVPQFQGQFTQGQVGVSPNLNANFSGNVNSVNPAPVGSTVTHQGKNSNSSTGKSKMLEIDISHQLLSQQAQVPPSTFQHAQPPVN